VRLTTLPPSRAECHKIWKPESPGTLWATPGLLRGSFTFTFLCNSGVSRNSVLDFVRRPNFFSLYGNDYFRSLFYLVGRIERNEIRPLLGL
jgi:hypothetical protein